MRTLLSVITISSLFLMAACSPAASLSTPSATASPNPTAFTPTATPPPIPATVLTARSRPWKPLTSFPALPPSYIFLDTPNGILSFAINSAGSITSFPASSTNISPSGFDRGYFDLSPNGQLIAIAQVAPYPGIGLQSSIRILSPRDGHIWQAAPKGSNFPAWSPDGESIAYVDYLNNRMCLATIDGPYRCLPQIGFLASGPPRWSPDGTQLAYCADMTLGVCDVYVTSLSTGESFLVASDGGGPEWSPDGTRLTFSSCPPEGCILHVANIAACEDPTAGCLTTVEQAGNAAQATWSPDGSRIAALSTTQDGSYGISVLDSGCLIDPAICPEDIIQLTDPSLAVGDYVWSPDGKALAFVAQHASGRSVYIALADGSGTAQVADIASDFFPMLQWGPE